MARPALGRVFRSGLEPAAVAEDDVVAAAGHDRVAVAAAEDDVGAETRRDLVDATKLTGRRALDATDIAIGFVDDLTVVTEHQVGAVAGVDHIAARHAER